jgi:hypothetical protein
VVTNRDGSVDIRDERAWNVNVVLSGVSPEDARTLAALLVPAAKDAK